MQKIFMGKKACSNKTEWRKKGGTGKACESRRAGHKNAKKIYIFTCTGLEKNDIFWCKSAGNMLYYISAGFPAKTMKDEPL